MKNECDIVQDLLFSYSDAILSKTSTEFVEEHLKNCSICKEYLNEIKIENDKENSEKEIDFFKEIRRKLNKKNILIYISLIIIIFIIGINITIFRHYNNISSTMSIYLKEDITDEEIEEVKKIILENTNNIELEYVSKEQELKRLKDKMEENSYILNNYDSGIVPAHFDIKTKKAKEVEQIKSATQNLPGVEFIDTKTNLNPYELFWLDYIKR